MGNVCSIQMPCCRTVEANNEEVMQTVQDKKNDEEVLQTVQDKKRQQQTEHLESLLHKVCDCLMDEQVGTLAIFGDALAILGDAGDGKTTLLTLVYDKFRNTSNDFDVVIRVTVAKASRLAGIQAEIWNQLGIYDDQWERKSCDDKATDIFKVLSNKKFFLLLDGWQDKIDLIKVGVPLQRRGNRSKIVFGGYITEKMDVDKHILVPSLKKSDGWKLFEKIVGEEVLCLDPAIPPIAKALVVEECWGSPLLINITARAMANKKTVQEWRDAKKLISLEKYWPYNILKVSYDNLPNERVKSCFLYCALFPPNYKILKDDLVSYWICESFWEDCDNGVDVADNEGYQIIDILVHACLLEDKGNYVTMHLLVQEAALEIAYKSKNDHLFVSSGDQLVEAPKIVEWEGISRMSLMENNIPNLTEVPVCPNLLTLLLSHNPHLVVIIDGFFQNMNALTVLDLSNTSINELPAGISKLFSLQYLNISHTWIEQLPLELQMLSKLKYLVLEYNGLLRLIPRRVIASMPKLQVLRIFSCGVSLVHSEDNILGYNNEHVKELEGLKHLHTLTITITSVATLQNLFNVLKSRTCIKALSLKCFWGEKSFDISLFADMKDLETLEIYQIDYLEELKVGLKIKQREIEDFGTLHNSTILWERSFNNLQEVTVGKCFHLKELTWVILAPNLKVLKVIDCKEMEEIININKLGEVSNIIGEHLNPFFNLEVIVLEKLPKLKSIYWCALSFPCIEKIKIVDCPMLKKLPLNSSSAMSQRVLIHAEEHWWNCIEWDDDAIRIALLRGFVQVS